MNKNLLKTLVCPQCHHDVDYEKSTQQVTCSVCQLAFPVKDGIPVMLLEEASCLKA